MLAESWRTAMVVLPILLLGTVYGVDWGLAYLRGALR